MNPLIVGNFAIKPRKESGLVVLTWEGRCDAKEPLDFLLPYFNELMPEIRGNRLEIDFTTLGFLNSSTVSVIIRFSKNLSQEKIQTIFLFNRASSWQVSVCKTLSVVLKQLTDISLEYKSH